MSARLEIDSLRFARGNEALSGSFPMAELGRLSDLRGEQDAPVSFQLNGQVVAGRPSICLSVTATVGLVCQRCLGRFDQSVSIEICLPVARNDAEMQRWESDDPMLDVLVADPHLDVRSLVEEEILLGLPLAPRHLDETCGLDLRLDVTN